MNLMGKRRERDTTKRERDYEMNLTIVSNKLANNIISSITFANSSLY